MEQRPPLPKMKAHVEVRGRHARNEPPQRRQISGRRGMFASRIAPHAEGTKRSNRDVLQRLARRSPAYRTCALNVFARRTAFRRKCTFGALTCARRRSPRGQSLPAPRRHRRETACRESQHRTPSLGPTPRALPRSLSARTDKQKTSVRASVKAAGTCGFGPTSASHRQPPR